MNFEEATKSANEMTKKTGRYWTAVWSDFYGVWAITERFMP